MSYAVLKSWGYTPDEAEHEGRVALFLLGDKAMRYPKAFLGAVLRNNEINKYRGLENKVVHIDVSDAYSLEAPSNRVYDGDAFMDLLNTLPEDKQELLFMCYFMGYSNKELMAKYGVKQGTIKSRLHRACAELSGRISQEIH